MAVAAITVVYQRARTAAGKERRAAAARAWWALWPAKDRRRYMRAVGRRQLRCSDYSKKQKRVNERFGLERHTRIAGLTVAASSPAAIWCGMEPTPGRFVAKPATTSPRMIAIPALVTKGMGHLQTRASPVLMQAYSTVKLWRLLRRACAIPHSSSAHFGPRSWSGGRLVRAGEGRVGRFHSERRTISITVFFDSPTFRPIRR
jgi:hypothetical protein